MKKFILVLAFLLISFAAAAQSVYPHVYNNGNSVSIDAWNNSDRQVRCSGSINLDFSDNRHETISVFEFIWPRGSLYRTYYPSTLNATIQYVSNSVWCN